MDLSMKKGAYAVEVPDFDAEVLFHSEILERCKAAPSEVVGYDSDDSGGMWHFVG
jgi:hypothetical protein